MRFNVVLLNDIDDSLQNLTLYFDGIHNIDFKLLRSRGDFEEYARETKIHLILANDKCVKLDVFSICEDLRAAPSTRFTPFLFLSKQDNFPTVKKAYEIGVSECVISPFKLEELLIRVNSHIAIYQTLQKGLVQNERLATIVATDSLTKVSNRTHIQTILLQSIKEFARYDRIFSIVYFQISEMQKINMIFGFAKGDQILKKVAQFVSKNIRESDIVARWSGSDFIIFAPSSALNNTDLLVKKLSAKLFQDEDLKQFHLRIHYGLTQVKQDDTIYSIVERANKALHHSIDNQLVCSSFA
jgi:diguanylate cyclase (GGDEF)-like protein